MIYTRCQICGQIFEDDKSNEYETTINIKKIRVKKYSNSYYKDLDWVYRRTIPTCLICGQNIACENEKMINIIINEFKNENKFKEKKYNKPISLFGQKPEEVLKKLLNIKNNK